MREFVSWIESNILLELAAAPFSKSDETLMPEAGSCANCPKRTGFNALLFADVRNDSCTDPQCFRAKLDAHVSKTLKKKPELVQISSAWNNREGAPLGRNRYVELDVKRAKLANQAAKANPAQRTCEKMTDAIVMDGGRRGQTVKVCADPACRIHHGNRPSPQEVARERAEERKRMEKEKLAITLRHRVLAAILQRVSPPLKKSDLLVVVHYLISRLQFAEAAQIAKRHKVGIEMNNGAPEQALLKHVSRLDDIELSRLMIELSLISFASRVPSKHEIDVLLTTAKHYRIEIEKLEKEVAQKFSEKQKKPTKAKTAVA